MHDSIQRIRERAHAIWEEEGRPHGNDVAHWERAERELREAQPAPGSVEQVSGNVAPMDASDAGSDAPAAASRASAKRKTTAPATKPQ